MTAGSLQGAAQCASLYGIRVCLCSMFSLCCGDKNVFMRLASPFFGTKKQVNMRNIIQFLGEDTV